MRQINAAQCVYAQSTYVIEIIIPGIFELHEVNTALIVHAWPTVAIVAIGLVSSKMRQINAVLVLHTQSPHAIEPLVPLYIAKCVKSTLH